MNKLRRTLISAFALAATPVSLGLRAQSPGNAGYSTLGAALQTEDPAKVEVAEFFWYGCIHCFNFESVLEAWVPSLPPDVYFRRIPAVFGEPRGMHDAAIFYAFEALGVLNKLHRPLFDAIHKDRLRTDNPAALGEWADQERPRREEARRGDEVLRRAKQGEARGPADRGRAHRRHARPDGAGPLYHQRRTGRVPRRHAGQRRSS